MKELITTQLIEEYRLQLDFAESQYKLQSLNNAQDPTLKNTLDCLKRFIHSLQSKQSEERQNIVDAVDNAIKTTLNSNTNIVLTGEDYFNQTFKQEQK